MLDLFADGASQPATASKTPGFFEALGVPLLFMVLIFWLLLWKPKSAENKKFQAMQSNLKKGDRVQTIGGALGTVVNVTEHEITLKVDESTNTKMTFVRSAVAKVLGSGETGGKT